MLVAAVDGQRVEAARGLVRDLEYICPGCGGRVLLKAGNQKIAHFAHRVVAGCVYAVGETIAHMTAKKLFCDAARGRGLRAELEYVIGDQRADVAIWSPDNDLIVVELQHTNLDIDDLKRRISGYRRKRIPQLWIPFLDTKYFTGGRNRMDKRFYINDDWVIERYSPKPFERYLGKIYGNNLWFYAEVNQMICRGNFSEHWIEKEGGDFGNESYAGYEYISRRWRKLSIIDATEVSNVMFALTPNELLGVGMET